MGDLRAIVDFINKENGPGTLFFGDDYQELEVRRISTGSLYLDWAMNGGIPTGKITEIFGNESNGKSALAAKVVANAQKKGMSCVWLDAENSFDPVWMKILGVDVENLVVTQGAEGEVSHDLLLKLVSLGNPRSKEYKDFDPIDLVVVDSWAALTPMTIMDNDIQNQVALDARLNNQGIKRINARNKNTAVLVINQNRSGIGRMSFDFQPGGRGLKFYAAMRIDIRKGEEIKANQVPAYMKVPVNPKDKDSPVGHNIRARVKKCKVGGPHGKEANFDFYYAGKIDQIKDIIAVGRITGAIEQSGAFYKYNDKSYKGAAAFAQFLRSDREALRAIRTEVLANI